MRGALEGLGRWCLRLLWGAGGGAAVFLLLCAAGVVDPETLGPAPAEAALPAVVWTQPQPEPLQVTWLDPEDLDRWEEAVRGRDGAAVTMKGPDGSLAWVSALPQAVDSGASYALPARNRAILTGNKSDGPHTVAAVACLRDDALVWARPDLALRRASGSPWRDESGGGWLDPEKQEVQTYVIGLCRELADLGFDEIVLTHCRYPAGYDGTEDRNVGLETFCRRVQRGLAEYPVLLSVEGAAGEEGPAPHSGQTLALLASFQRVWVPPGTETALGEFCPSLLPEE